MEASVKAVYKGNQIAKSIFGEVECMVSATEAVLEVAQDGVDPIELRQVLGFAPTHDEAGWRRQPASMTPAKQANPSEMTTQPGLRSRLARSAIAWSVKPGSGAILMWSGCA